MSEKIYSIGRFDKKIQNNIYKLLRKDVSSSRTMGKGNEQESDVTNLWKKNYSTIFPPKNIELGNHTQMCCLCGSLGVQWRSKLAWEKINTSQIAGAEEGKRNHLMSPLPRVAQLRTKKVLWPLVPPRGRVRVSKSVLASPGVWVLSDSLLPFPSRVLWCAVWLGPGTCGRTATRALRGISGASTTEDTKRVNEFMERS